MQISTESNLPYINIQPFVWQILSYMWNHDNNNLNVNFFFFLYCTRKLAAIVKL